MGGKIRTSPDRHEVPAYGISRVAGSASPAHVVKGFLRTYMSSQGLARRRRR